MTVAGGWNTVELMSPTVNKVKRKTINLCSTCVRKQSSSYDQTNMAQSIKQSRMVEMIVNVFYRKVTCYQMGLDSQNPRNCTPDLYCILKTRP